jgi:hypothetical protein
MEMSLWDDYEADTQFEHDFLHGINNDEWTTKGRNNMKYIFITDGCEPYVSDFTYFNEAICEYKEFIQGVKAYPVFDTAIQSLTPQQAIQLYNDLVCDDDKIRIVYEVGNCIWEDI